MKRRSKILLVLSLAAVMVLSGCSKDKKPEEVPEEKEETVGEQPKQEKKEVAVPVYIAEGIRKLSVVTQGEENLQISYEPKEHESSYEYWKIRKPYGEEAIVDTEAVLELYHSLEKLDFSQPADVPEGEETGLAESTTSIALEFCQTNQEERLAVLSGEAYESSNSPSYKAEADSTCTLKIGRKNEAGDYYGELSSNAGVFYLIPAETIEPVLKADPFALILKVSAVVSIDTVDEITVTMDGKEYLMEEYDEFYTELLSVLITAEIDEPERVSEEVLLKLHFARNIKAEDDLTIEYHEYDDQFGTVSVNGSENFLVKLEDIERLKDIIKEHL